jgi:hypothetical protein
MSKWFIYGLAVGLVLLAVAGTSASRRHQRTAQEEKYRAELAQYTEELVDATQVQPGVLTERQRLHSKLFAYRSFTNKTITDLLAHPESRVLGIDVLIGQGVVLIESRTPESYFGELVRTSDAVIHGRVTKKISQITDDSAFIFTDYDVVLTEILKDSSVRPLAIGETITVTRPGGKVVIDGIVVKANDRAFEPLPLYEHPVLLFLRYIPETGAYRATRDVGTFEVDGSLIRPLTRVPYPPGVLRDGVSSLQTVRAISRK